jgi:ABC-type dipeptide/oligopeptide/nickel transport system permease component
MRNYVASRAVDAGLTVWLVLTLVFFAMRVLPGDPAMAALGDQATSEQLEQFRAVMGLNHSLLVQYGHFLWDMTRLDFGRSFRTAEPIGDLLAAALPYTLELAGAALIVGAAIGVPAGVVAATQRGRAADYVARLLSLVGLCMPEFYLGALLLIVFALRLDLFPIMGGGGGSVPDRLYHLVLPGITLGLVMASFTARLTRSSLLEVLRRDYVRTARARGAPERVVIWRHALRNAMIPVVTGFGIYILTMLSGSISIELVFARPGLGTVLVSGILARDYPVVQAGLVVFAFCVVVVNLTMDVLYAVIDPRIRVDGTR